MEKMENWRGRDGRIEGKVRKFILVPKSLPQPKINEQVLESNVEPYREIKMCKREDMCKEERFALPRVRLPTRDKVGKLETWANTSTTVVLLFPKHVPKKLCK